jgi:Predicted Fe-S oxidoreductases
LYRYIDNEKKPKSLRFRKLLEKVLLNQDYKSLGDFHETALFVGSMHFQDIYNIDIERVKRCVIHYATPDPERRIIPFCAYNTIYRDKIERKYAVPIDEWRKEHIGNEGV